MKFHLHKVYYSLLFLSLYITCEHAFGISPASFLQSGFDAQGIAYGKAYSAIVSNPSALYWNPAGIAKAKGKIKLNFPNNTSSNYTSPEIKDIIQDLDKLSKQSDLNSIFLEDSPKEFNDTNTISSFSPIIQVYLSGSLLSLDREQGMMAVSFSSKVGYFGLGIIGHWVQNIKTVDHEGNDLGQNIPYFELAEYIGYAISIKNNFRLGITATVIQQNIDNLLLHGGSINIGFQSNLFSFLQIGTVIHNLAGIIETNDSTQSIIKELSSAKLKKLDTIFDFTLTVSIIPPQNKFKISLGFDINLDLLQQENVRSYLLKAGASYQVTSYLTLLAGVNSNHYSFGVGVIIKSIDINYAITQNFLINEIKHTISINGTIR